MIAKVILGTMTNARKLVSIAERISCDVELCSGRYVVNAKSMLGVLSMPEFEYGELHIHTDEENECNQVLERLLEEGLLADTNDAAKRSLYDITTFGEILIDFTWQGVNEDGQTLFAQNPGGAPANVAVVCGLLARREAPLYDYSVAGRPDCACPFQRGGFCRRLRRAEDRGRLNAFLLAFWQGV